MAKKIIAVIGATGAQGGGLARAIQNDRNGEFQARAVTRDAGSEKAKELKQLGIDVIEADIDDQAAIQRAFEGAYGAYCVTFYWAHMSPEREKAEAKNMAEAAKRASLRHVIWSTLEDTRNWIPLSDNRMPTLMGAYKVPHFDAKGESDKYFTSADVPVTFLRAAFYWDNFIYFGLGPKKRADGVLELTLPLNGSKLPGIASEDIGKCAYGVFKRGAEYIGKTVGIAGELLTGDQMAAAMTNALGREVLYNGVTPQVFRAFGFPGSEDIGNMFQFQTDFQKEFLDLRDPALAKSLNPELQSFDRWLAQNARRIPLD